MSEEIVHCEGGVTLLGGGAVASADVALALTLAPTLVAADGGGDHALALGLMPRAVIGDMDSLSAPAAQMLAGRIHRVDEQDSTDFGKCLRLVRADFYLGLGFTGLRLDHTLSALNEVAARPARRVLLIAEEEVIFRAPTRLTLNLNPGERLSLYPMGLARGRSIGLRWPIDGITFTPGGRIGTSNEALGPVHLEIEGPMLVMLAKDRLTLARDALFPPPPVHGG